jgi:hypothetical protein
MEKDILLKQTKLYSIHFLDCRFVWRYRIRCRTDDTALSLLGFCRTVSQNDLNSMPWFYYRKKMNWVGFEPASAATAAFLERRLYLHLEEIAKKGTNDCSNLTWSTLLTNFLLLHTSLPYISLFHINYQPLVTANNPHCTWNYFHLSNLELSWHKNLHK